MAKAKATTKRSVTDRNRSARLAILTEVDRLLGKMLRTPQFRGSLHLEVVAKDGQIGADPRITLVEFGRATLVD